MITEQIIIDCIGAAAQAGKGELVATLTDELNVMRNPVVEKKHREKNNTTGYVQFDIETGKEIARFETVKEANQAMGKKDGASCISQACRNFRVGKSNRAYGFAWKYGEDADK